MIKKSHYLSVFTLLASVSINALYSPSSIAANEVREDREPEATITVNEKKGVFGQSHMVSTAHPHASEAALSILEKGGSAVDAAIAAQIMLTLVEPQSSGIGGGSFMMHYDARSRFLTTLDGRETAPAGVTPDYFLRDGKKPQWKEAIIGGRSVGVPGTVRMLEEAHEAHGKLPWAVLLEPTIKLAEKGFRVTPRLSGLLKRDINPGLKKHQASMEYFFPGGKPLETGDLLKNQALADVLKQIAKDGTGGFYYGENAKAIVNAVTKNTPNPGVMTLKDLQNYDAKERDPVCTEYHKNWVCSMGPPSSGGVTLIQILKQLESFNLSKVAPLSAEAIHLFTQSSRLAFADRNHYLADSDFVRVPVQKMIQANYLQSRAALISENDMGKAQPGDVKQYRRRYGRDQSPEFPNTSHLSVVDKWGNAVAMTSSIEHAFGSGVMVNGYLLNNELTDFSLVPTVDGKPVMNRIEPGKRPRSSMTPVIVFDSQKNFMMALGSPGGSRIINYVAWTLVGVLDWKLSLQTAISMPRVTNRNDYTSLEKGTDLEVLKEKLEAKKHKVKIRDLNSGLHGVLKTGSQYEGAADPRREGVAMGK